VVELYDNTPYLDDDLSSGEEEEEEEIEEVITVVRNEIKIPVVVTENWQQTMVERIVIEDRLGETIVVDDSQDKIEELTATIARLREELIYTNVELVRVQSTLHQNPESKPPEKLFFLKEAWDVQYHLRTRNGQRVSLCL
jgi:hypothetical protein